MRARERVCHNGFLTAFLRVFLPISLHTLWGAGVHSPRLRIVVLVVAAVVVVLVVACIHLALPPGGASYTRNASIT